MHIVIFAGGDFVDSSLSRSVLKKSDVVIAADGGAVSALKIGITPKAVVGDFDSLPEIAQKNLIQQRVSCIVAHKEKDETDTELAIAYATKIGATKITILGGLMGNRIDHIMASMLYSFV